MNRRSLVQMTSDEIAAYLTSPRSITVATYNKDGSIHLTAMFYVVIDGDLWFWSYTSSQKIVNLRRNPSLSVLVESGRDYSELQGVHLVGRGEIHDDPAVVLDVGWRIAQFHSTPDAAANWEDIARAGRKRVAVRVEVLRTVSWDHRKLEQGVH